MFNLGPVAKRQLLTINREWAQGQHVLITGMTGSGKTALARYLDEMRLQNGGSVMVFIAKLQPDETVQEMYRGWTRWKTWKKFTLRNENRVIFWPDVEGKAPDVAMEIMRREYKIALDNIGKSGRWMVHLDEGYLTCHPSFMGLQNEVGLMYALLRSAHGTMLTIAQRPSHLPLSIYANLSQAFIGRASELGDLRRLADIDGGPNTKELREIIRTNKLHDFTWIQAGADSPPEQVNLSR